MTSKTGVPSMKMIVTPIDISVIHVGSDITYPPR
jgi:hypothetical protein